MTDPHALVQADVDRLLALAPPPLGVGVDLHLDEAVRDLRRFVSCSLVLPSDVFARMASRRLKKRVSRQRRRDLVALRRTRDRHDRWEVEERAWGRFEAARDDETDQDPFASHPHASEHCGGCGELGGPGGHCFRCGVFVCEGCEVKRCAEGFHACPFCGRSLGGCEGTRTPRRS